MKAASPIVFLVLVLGLMRPALADLPDPVRFGIRMELGDVGQAREWLDAGLAPDFIGDRIGTGLMIAAWEGNIPLMELFVARGANVNESNAIGEQALMHAAWRGKFDAVKWLIDHGAQVNRAPLQWTALHYAVFAGHAEVAQYLIDHGADINARSTNGSSVLMMAAYEGNETMAQKLVALGADRSIRNDRGDGALEWAMKFKHMAVARAVSGPQQFAAAANLSKEHWGQPVRSLPAARTPAQAQTDELQDLLNVRRILVAHDMPNAVKKLDAQIAALRAKRAAPKTPPRSDELDELLNVRRILVARDMPNAVKKLDAQIAALRAGLDKGQPAVLEISASRSAPDKQHARLVTRQRTN